MTMSWIMACSETWEPTTNLRRICFSILWSCSWSSAEVKPSTPLKVPLIAADIVETLKSLNASFTSASFAKGCIFIFARDSEILTIASSCLFKIKSQNKIRKSQSKRDEPNSDWNTNSFSSVSFMRQSSRPHQHILTFKLLRRLLAQSWSAFALNKLEKIINFLINYEALFLWYGII